MAETRRSLVDAGEHDDRRALTGGLAVVVVEVGLLERGERDERVENAVAVSFVEDTVWWEPAADGFISSWAPALWVRPRARDRPRLRPPRAQKRDARGVRAA